MSINIGPPSVDELRPRITVIGVGGAGGNAIANMIQSEIEGVDFIVANTDAQALNSSIAEHRIQLGPEITRGLGAGSRPEVGRAAAEETIEEIERALDGMNMVFVAAGMGGGTGTGAAPVIAEIARSKGILTVGVVTKPFQFEGTRRMRSADSGIEELQKNVDTLIVIPNQNLFLVAKAETTFKEAFQLADEVLQMGVRSITDLMVMPGLINLDFADVRSVMGEMGKAMMGTGEGSGENRALEAAERAIANPLLEGVSMKGAKGVIISIIGGEDMRLLEVDEAANHIRDLVDPDANIIWGSAFNPDLEGKIRVSVVATGIDSAVEPMRPASQPASYAAARGPRRPGMAAAPAAGAVSASAGGAGAAAPARAAGGAHKAEPVEAAAPEGAMGRTPRPPRFGSEAKAPATQAADAESEHEAGKIAGPAERAGERRPGADGAREFVRRDVRDAAALPLANDDDLTPGSTTSDPEEDVLELTMEVAQEPEPARPARQSDLGFEDERAGRPARVAQSTPQPLRAAPPASERPRMLGRPAGGSEAGSGSGSGSVAGRGASSGAVSPAPAQRSLRDRSGGQERADGGARPAPGGTLFERMANLPRTKARTDAAAKSERADGDDEGGSSLRIPRFLGRQNNQ